MWKCTLHPSLNWMCQFVDILPRQGDNGECQVGY
jgi:hypothetical protein